MCFETLVSGHQGLLQGLREWCLHDPLADGVSHLCERFYIIDICNRKQRIDTLIEILVAVETP